MKFRVQIDKRAIEDIQHGIDYYEEQVTGLGDKFLNEIDQQMELLSQIHSSRFAIIRFVVYLLGDSHSCFTILFWRKEKLSEFMVSSTLHLIRKNTG